VENKVKNWIDERVKKINEMGETDLLKTIKEEIAADGKFYKSQNEWFLQVDDSLLIQVRINRRYCPINEVPAQLLLKLTKAEKVLVVIVNNSVVSYKEVTLSED